MNVQLHRLLNIYHVAKNRAACICSVKETKKIRIKTNLFRPSLVYLHLNLRAIRSFETSVMNGT
jgi:hypothetical protein